MFVICCRLDVAALLFADESMCVVVSSSLLVESIPNNAIVTQSIRVKRAIARSKQRIVDARHFCGCRRRLVEREERNIIGGICSLYCYWYHSTPPFTEAGDKLDEPLSVASPPRSQAAALASLTAEKRPLVKAFPFPLWLARSPCSSDSPLSL